MHAEDPQLVRDHARHRHADHPRVAEQQADLDVAAALAQARDRVHARRRGWPSASSETCAPPPVTVPDRRDHVRSAPPPRRPARARAPACASSMSTATTRAPAATAIITAASPTPPQPCTATHSPARTPACTCSAAQAVMKRQPRTRPRRRDNAGRHRDEVQVRARQRDVLGERAPGREPRLEVALADLRLALPAGLADAAAAAERDRHAVADRPAAHRRARPPPPRRRARARRTCGSAIDGSWPIQPCQSLRQTPEASTRSTTPSGGHDGSGTSSSDERLLEGAHHGGAHRPIVASLDPLSLPPDELRRLGHHVWDRLVDRWEQLDAQPPIAPIDPDFTQASIAPCPDGPSDPQQAIDELFDAHPPARPARRPPALLRPHRQPEQPGLRAGRPDRHRPQRVRRQLDRRRGRVGARAGHARLARASGWGCRTRPRASSSAAARSARSPRSPPPRTTAPRIATRPRATSPSTPTPRSRRPGASSASTRPTCACCKADPAYRLQPSPIEAAIAPRPRGRPAAVPARRHRRARRAPAASTRSTTSPTSPRSEGLWFHVDGAYGAPARLTARGKDLLTGIERADSLVLDPHKWLFQPYEIGAVLVRHPGLLAAHVHARRRLPARHPHRHGRAARVRPAAHPLGARAEALAVAARLRPRRLQGRDRAHDRARRVRRGRARAPRRLGGRLARDARAWSASGARATATTQTDALVRAAVADGFAAPSTTILDGRAVVRLCTINPRTTEADIAADDRPPRATSPAETSPHPAR